MWLDRFSAHSTPSASPVPWNRPPSAAPSRKSSHLAPNALPRRPGLPQRITSWSGLTNGSVDTLPATARLPNGTNLRDQLGGADDGTNAQTLETLEEILGTARGADHGSPGQAQPAEQGLVEDIDFGDMSLTTFVESVLPAVSATKDQQATQFSGVDKSTLMDLHKSVAACDEVLASVEKNLTSFQADLAAVSAEIESLQTRSTSLDARLQARKEVEKLLGPEVEALSLSPAAIRKVAEGAVDESWLKSLADIDKCSMIIESKAKTCGDSKSIRDIRPLLENLKDRAVERIRDYVVAQIKNLRSPGVNAQMLQQTALIKYKDAFAFLAKRQPQLEQEIAQAYMNTMRWYYLSNFTRYKTALDKLQLHTVDRVDALVQDESNRRGVGNKPVGPHDQFVLGRRKDLLTSPSQHALNTYVTEEDKSLHNLEIPFRNFNLALIDNASTEFSFLTTFFATSSFHVLSRRFQEIFEPTLALGQSLTKKLVENTTDALGILLCVRLNQHFAFELQRRKVSTMEMYVNGTGMLLWPRFQQVMDLHCEALRKATIALTGRPTGSALSLTNASSNVQSLAPHPITQRFANFVQGILVLSTEAGDDEPVQRSVGRTRDEFQAFLTKLSKSIPVAKKRDRFLFNNYSLVGTIIHETEGRMADEVKSHFADIRNDLAD